MKELIEFINAMPADERDPFADRVGTTIGYIRKAASVGQLLKPELCVAIEKDSKAKLTRQMLRPHDWMRIWPELVGPVETQPDLTQKAA